MSLIDEVDASSDWPVGDSAVKICYSALYDGSATEADEPEGDNVGSAAVEAESFVSDYVPVLLDRSGDEAIDDLCHHNVVSVCMLPVVRLDCDSSCHWDR